MFTILFVWQALRIQLALVLPLYRLNPLWFKAYYWVMASTTSTSLSYFKFDLHLHQKSLYYQEVYTNTPGAISLKYIILYPSDTFLQCDYQCFWKAGRLIKSGGYDFHGLYMNLESSEVLNVYQDYIVITASRILVSVFFVWFCGSHRYWD